MIARMRGECTVFMSTHILGDVERVCDTIGIVNHGKMVVEAKQADLLTRYSIPAYDLECEPGTEAAFRSGMESLKSVAWVRSVSMDGGAAHVVVQDIQIARVELLPRLVQCGVVLRRFEAVKASLEDVFMQLVSQEEEK